MNPPNKSGVIILILISVILTLLSILIPRGSFIYTGDKSELSDVRIGLPIPFVTQNLSNWDPPISYHQAIQLYSPLESPTRLLWPQFIFSLVIIFSIVFVAGELIRFVIGRRKTSPSTRQ